MHSQQLVNLKPKVQTIIDLLAKKDWDTAQLLLLEVMAFPGTRGKCPL